MISELDAVSICGQVEEAIKCAICWDPPEQPKILPCQHTFCLRCIEPAHRADVQQRILSRDRVQCPICRKTYRVPKPGLEALPTDYRVNELKDIVHKKRYMQKRRFCMVCSMLKRSAVGTNLCLTCCTLLCTKCYGNHKANQSYKDHLQVPILTSRTNHLLCADHPREFVQCYCEQCDQPVCIACIHDDHTGHKTSDFVHTKSTDTSVIKGIQKQVTIQRECVRLEKEKLLALMSRNKAEQTAVKAELESLSTNDEVGDQSTDMLENLTVYHQLLADKLVSEQAKLNEITGQLNETDSVLHRAAFPLSSHETITVRSVPLGAVHREFSRIALVTNSVSLLAEEYPKVTNDSGLLSRRVKQFEHKSSIFYEIVPRRSEPELMWKKDVDAYDVQFLQDGSKHIVYSAKSLDWKLHFIDFTGNDLEVPDHLAEYAQCECRVVTSPVTRTLSFTYKTAGDGLRLPFLTIHRGGQMTKGTIFTSREQLSLCSLAVSRTNDMVFTFMEYQYPPNRTSIRCHRPQGEFRWISDTSIGNWPRELGTPYYVIVDHLDRIIVSDHRGCKVSIFDNTGKHLLSFPRESLWRLDAKTDIDQDDSKPKPAGLCVDSHNNIYVAFPSHQVISKFSPNGGFIEHVMHTPGKPRGISLINDRYLAMGVWEEGLCLYDLFPGRDGSDAEDEHEDTSTVDSNSTEEISDASDKSEVDEQLDVGSLEISETEEQDEEEERHSSEFSEQDSFEEMEELDNLLERVVIRERPEASSNSNRL